MRISARNILKGKVKRVTHGLVDSEITVELACGTEIISTINKSSAEHLGLKEGQVVSAVIEGTDVMIGLD